MRRWLLDTNVISETRRPRPSPAAIAWLESLDLEQICTSEMNIAELRYGAFEHKDKLLRSEISSWIDRSVKPWLDGRIFAIGENVLLSWRILARRREQAREPAPAVDLLIAAVATTNELAVATRDVAPFVACGLPVLNPWTGERFNGA
jgi:predicted nucleic acid-binding protein